MTNLQIIRRVAKQHGLRFVRTNSTLNGAYLYNFVNSAGRAVATNWTVSSAINEYHYGDLNSKIS